MAELIFYYKDETPELDIIEKRVWKVKKSKDFPNGIKYSLVYVHKGKRVLGYDNERSKRDHKHYFEKEEKYNFTDINKLSDDFEYDVKKLRRELYGNQES